jgi:hypothetical protein
MKYTSLANAVSKTAAMIVCGLGAISAQAAPLPVVLKSQLTAGYPSGSQFYRDHLSFSDDGRFLLISGRVTEPFPSNKITNISKVFDIYRGLSIDLATRFPQIIAPSNLPFAISASGRYVLAGKGILDLKTGIVTTSPFTNTAQFRSSSPLGNEWSVASNNAMSDNGRYVTHQYQATGCKMNGYVFDQLSGSSKLATPRYNTASTPLCGGDGWTTGTLLSGDGKIFFWGTDGTDVDTLQRWGLPNPTSRDLFAHNWTNGSTENNRFSNCSFCGDSSYATGSSAYEYDVSEDGTLAIFTSYVPYGFFTDQGEPSNGQKQVFLRDAKTLRVELISASDSRRLESSPATSYQNPSMSADGRFVAFTGEGNLYIRDRQASKKIVAQTGVNYAVIADNGRFILVEKADGWYRTNNPYWSVLSSEINFTNNYLFVTLPNNKQSWRTYDPKNGDYPLDFVVNC